MILRIGNMIRGVMVLVPLRVVRGVCVVVVFVPLLVVLDVFRPLL